MSTALGAKRPGRKTRNRDYFLEAGREYVRLYGADDLTAAAFNTSAALRGGRSDKAEAYLRGRPNPDGSFPAGTPEDPVRPWPSLNAIKAEFGGFSDFRKALDLKPNSSGPRRHRRKGEADPILDVRVRRVFVPSEGTAWLRKQLAAAERRASRAEERLEVAKREILNTPADAREIENLRKRLADERSRRKTVQRELLNAERRETRARAREEALRDGAGDATLLKEIERLTDRLADAEARPARASAPRPEPRVITKTKTRTRTVTVQDERLLRQVERMEARVSELRADLARSEEARVELADRLATIRRDAVADALATERVRRADRRVAELERHLAKQSELLVGERRVLTQNELAKLRRDGPAGEKQFVAMVKRIGRAEGKIARKAAIYDALVAGYNWIERL